MQTLSIVIPVFNEEALIGKVIDDVIHADSLGLKKEIIIVDDGSTDGTTSKIENFRLDPRLRGDDKHISIKIIFRKKNQGKGAALKAGFKKSTGDILMVQDADREYNVKDYPVLLTPFLNNNASVVYGSRNKKRENFHNRYSYLSFYMGGLMLTWYVNLLFGLHLTDQPTGYKLFSRKILSQLLTPKENGFSFEVAITASLAKHGVLFFEVPIHYKPRTLEEGKKINALDFLKSIFVALKYKFTSAK